MKKFVIVMLIGICVLAGVAAPVTRKAEVVKAVTITETDTFTYDGTNASNYNGESVFIITDSANEGITDDMFSFEIARDLYEIKTKLMSVKTVIISDNATEIYMSMLKYFQGANKLHIGKMVNTIYMEDEDEFVSEDYMKALATIEVDEENSFFTVEDNVLYSIDMETLFIYPAEKKDTSFSIPDTVMSFAGVHMGINDYLLKLNFGSSFCTEDSPYNDINPFFLSLTSGLSYLEEITVDSDNAYLSSVNGVLYNKEQTKTIAWPGNLVMENVTFPSSLQSIALDMISNKDLVKTITLSRDMEKLWVFDFTSRLNSFTNLKEISVPLDNKFFTVWKGGLYNKKKTVFYGFPQKSPLTILELPNGITVIEIWNRVYPNIEKVILPSTFDEFYTHEGGGFTRFYEMFPNLKSVQISSKCTKYKSIDGVVYNKNGTILIAYPPKKEGSSYVIPDAVTSIEWSIFSGCANLKTLTIGKNLNANQSWYMLMEHSNISSFSTVKNCKNYITIDGILYNKKMTKLEAYPPYKKETTFKVPDSIINITNLYYARELKNLVIGKKVKDLCEFIYLRKLVSISVSKSNPYYMSKNGVLYNKDGTKVIYNPKE